MMSAPMSGNRRPDRATLLAFTGVVLFGGVNGLGVRQTVQELAPFWGATLRFLAAGLILLLIVLASRRPLPRGRSLLGGVVYAAVGFAASYGFVYQGLQHLSAGTTQVLVALTRCSRSGWRSPIARSGSMSRALRVP
jgi:drug/metabolite transporter (DMT)-like permease